MLLFVVVRLSLRKGRTRASNTFTTGDSRVIGLYELPSFKGFPGLGIGMIFPSFHIVEISNVSIQSLYVFGWSGQ